ncbi:SAICAR synthase-like protein [Neolentinus lepideus HHB14362 ss-1]|uniref:Kinase n=1 Tax=Neolentinus lepideus HHB14362 ss-1 TaxID=1314782 RepID=A0A165RPG7_9AGAM|nr:SAICAR synthase-like protein [Neolentinus lepideus HHB14362 ss-1]
MSLDPLDSLTETATSSGAHTPLSNQVGGHPGVLTVADDSLIIKPTLPEEFYFYQNVLTTSEFDKLRNWVPRFVGTLTHSGEANETGEVVLKSDTPSNDKEWIVLENVAANFTKPNIADFKLGTILYDDSASPEKKERMIKSAAETTSLTTGVRVTGFQIFDSATFQTIKTQKAYGKSIKSEELPEAFRQIFPVMSSSSPAEPSPDATPNPGLPAPALLRILLSLKTDIVQIREAAASIEMRMVGGSLLIVYEGHAQIAEAIWEATGGEPGEGEREREDRIAVEEAEELEELSEDEDADEEISDDGEEDTSFDTSATTTIDSNISISQSSASSVSSSSLSSLSSLSSDAPSAPYVVRLIDFAHTKLTPGRGPDEGILLGLDTVLKLLESRIEEVRKLT